MLENENNLEIRTTYHVALKLGELILAPNKVDLKAGVMNYGVLVSK